MGVVIGWRLLLDFNANPGCSFPRNEVMLLQGFEIPCLVPFVRDLLLGVVTSRRCLPSGHPLIDAFPSDNIPPLIPSRAEPTRSVNTHPKIPNRVPRPRY
jgi:hypothetical protein